MTKGAGHKSGHAANVAEAHRKAELAREHEEATKTKRGSANRVLDVKETKLLDELRKSLTPMVRRVDGGSVATAIPNRKHMLKKTHYRDTTKAKTGAREREENDDDDDEDEDNTARKKKKKKKRRRETNENPTGREETKTYANKAERKRLKRKKQKALKRRRDVLL